MKFRAGLTAMDFFRGAYVVVWNFLLFLRHRTRASPRFTFQCYKSSDERVGRVATSQHFPLRLSACVFDLRPRHEIQRRGSRGRWAVLQSAPSSEALGKTALRSVGWEVVGVTCSIMSSCSTSGIAGVCSESTSPTTTRIALTWDSPRKLLDNARQRCQLPL